MTSVAPQTKGERTQARILEAAIDRFGTNGFRATSVAAIARDAGVSAAAPFAYWPSKEALFDAAVDADARDVIIELLGSVDPEASLAVWVSLVPSLLAVLQSHPLARRVLAGQEPEVIHRLADLPALQDITAELADLLRDAQSRAEVPADVSIEDLAVGIETVVLSLLMSAVQVPVEADQRAPAILAVFQTLLRPPPD